MATMATNEKLDLTKILKVGDKVMSFMYGELTYVEELTGLYPLIFIDNKGYRRSYTISGFFIYKTLRADLYPIDTVFPEANWSEPHLETKLYTVDDVYNWLKEYEGWAVAELFKRLDESFDKTSKEKSLSDIMISAFAWYESSAPSEWSAIHDRLKAYESNQCQPTELEQPETFEWEGEVYRKGEIVAVRDYDINPWKFAEFFVVTNHFPIVRHTIGMGEIQYAQMRKLSSFKNSDK